MLLLTVAAGGNFVVEQPRSSLFFRHPRMVWLCKLLKARGGVQSMVTMSPKL